MPIFDLQIKIKIMANLTITNDRMLSVRRAAQSYIHKFKEREKFHVALEKFLKNTLKYFEEYADAENDICVDCALIENKKFVYEMTPDGGKILATDPIQAKEKQKQMRALGHKQITLDAYFVKNEDIPEDLEAGWYQLFLGVIIEKDPLEEVPVPEMTVENGVAKTTA
jgi:hypothetical protein